MSEFVISYVWLRQLFDHLVLPGVEEITRRIVSTSLCHLTHHLLPFDQVNLSNKNVPLMLRSFYVFISHKVCFKVCFSRDIFCQIIPMDNLDHPYICTVYLIHVFY